MIDVLRKAHDRPSKSMRNNGPDRSNNFKCSACLRRTTPAPTAACSLRAAVGNFLLVNPTPPAFAVAVPSRPLPPSLTEVTPRNAYNSLTAILCREALPRLHRPGVLTVAFFPLTRT